MVNMSIDINALETDVAVLKEKIEEARKYKAERAARRKRRRLKLRRLSDQMLSAMSESSSVDADS